MEKGALVSIEERSAPTDLLPLLRGRRRGGGGGGAQTRPIRCTVNPWREGGGEEVIAGSSDHLSCRGPSLLDPPPQVWGGPRVQGLSQGAAPPCRGRGPHTWGLAANCKKSRELSLKVFRLLSRNSYVKNCTCMNCTTKACTVHA